MAGTPLRCKRTSSGLNFGLIVYYLGTIKREVSQYMLWVQVAVVSAIAPGDDGKCLKSNFVSHLNLRWWEQISETDFLLMFFRM